MQPDEFIAKWSNSRLNERQGSQSFFNDLCALAEHPTPAEYGDPNVFAFEKWVPGGFADAYFEGRFAWEFKALTSQLDDAMNQLLRYQVHLKTPPLLIVSSFRHIRIRTNFPGMESLLHEIPIADLPQPENLALLRRIFHSPADFRPHRTVEKVTRETADVFQKIVADMELHTQDREKLARYLNQIIFCLYAQDAGLMGDDLFTSVVKNLNHRPALFDQAVRDLFDQMSGGGLFGYHIVPHFNGDLFNAIDTVEFSRTTLELLSEATGKNWRNIEPSIFGTLFERALDASKRSQLGAHYTGADDIELVVEPVLMDPLRQEWAAVQQKADALITQGDETDAHERIRAFQRRLASVTVLDPACGSGNFLYIAMRSLLNLEKHIIDYNDAQGWPEMHPAVKPSQMLGLEINPYAAELARAALWIGYIQWHQTNGIPYRQSPILTPMNSSIRLTDAILDNGDTQNPAETQWPEAEFIIGNPPFLGRGRLRGTLGDNYTNNLYSVFAGRLPNASDYCCYWFEKARAMIEQGITKRAGLLATQGIRGRDSRAVLQRIKDTGGIFMAYPDLEWTLDGANVHISIVGFDNGSETERNFNGQIITGGINADLSIGVDTTIARRLAENSGMSFEGPSPKAPFDIAPELAAEMLAAPINVNGRPNSDVVRPVMNARDLVQRSRGMFTIDFEQMGMDEACLYEMPFEQIKQCVYPVRLKKSQAAFRNRWWQYATPSPNMRQALSGLTRYIATPRVSKHRIFVWIESGIMCNDSTDVFAFDDDYSFGILHSRIHEVWSRAMGTQLKEVESGFRYTPTTCFETFPFPEPNDAQRAAISDAAKRLTELRENWLNPMDINGSPSLRMKDLKKRTLTNLYNARPTWLNNAHQTLDHAVAAAYNWPPNLDNNAILNRLLTLNLQRSEQ